LDPRSALGDDPHATFEQIVQSAKGGEGFLNGRRLHCLDEPTGEKGGVVAAFGIGSTLDHSAEVDAQDRWLIVHVFSLRSAELDVNY
jgi:hypothetical protein